MKKISISVAFAATILMAGCASQTGWTPTIDTYGDPRAGRVDQDMAECKKLADRASGGTAKEAAIGAGVGGLAGAAGGAAVGAAVGDPGIGAAIGAAVGGLGAAGQQGFEAEKRYKSAFNNCMSGRGHKVIR